METTTTNPTITGDTVTFEWRGVKAPGLVGDFNRWNASEPIPLEAAGDGHWRHTIKLPETAYVEYAYTLDGKRVDDPNNPRHVYNGINAHNHYFYMPGAGPSPFVKKERGVPHGVVKRFSVAGRYYLSGENRSTPLYQREVRLYAPPVTEPVPLLVVFDGPDYLNRARLPIMIDNLIHQRRIRPVAVAFVSNGKENRFLEYACSDATLGFLIYNVIPLAKSELNLVDTEREPGTYGVLGASMGGLISLYAGLRHPEVFGNVLSQSGAFYQKFVVHDLVDAGLARQIKIWMDVGTMEYLNPFNLQMHKLLVDRGYNVQFHEYAGGHNYTAWRDDLASGLQTIFG